MFCTNLNNHVPLKIPVNYCTSIDSFQKYLKGSKIITKALFGKKLLKSSLEPAMVRFGMKHKKIMNVQVYTSTNEGLGILAVK
jgi:hypothetical protein